MVYSLAMNAPA